VHKYTTIPELPVHDIRLRANNSDFSREAIYTVPVCSATTCMLVELSPNYCTWARSTMMNWNCCKWPDIVCILFRFIVFCSMHGNK